MNAVTTETRYLVEQLLREAGTKTVRLGRIVNVTQDEVTRLEDLLTTPRGKAAVELAAECPLRLTPLDHVTGEHVHLKSLKTGRVGCFRCNSELLNRPDVMETYEPTAAQRVLVATLGAVGLRGFVTA